MTSSRATTRYHDTEYQRPGIKVLPAQLYATDEEVPISTVLGSCVAACLYDPIARVGGMNHFMLPDAPTDPAVDPVWATRYGKPAMEALIRELLSLGARQERLEAKVFGGAMVLPGMNRLNVGTRNAAFVRHYLQQVGMRKVAEDLEGVDPRRVTLMPTTGVVRVRRLPRSDAGLAALLLPGTASTDLPEPGRVSRVARRSGPA